MQCHTARALESHEGHSDAMSHCTCIGVAWRPFRCNVTLHVHWSHMRAIQMQCHTARALESHESHPDAMSHCTCIGVVFDSTMAWTWFLDQTALITKMISCACIHMAAQFYSEICIQATTLGKGIGGLLIEHNWDVTKLSLWFQNTAQLKRHYFTIVSYFVYLCVQHSLQPSR